MYFFSELKLYKLSFYKFYNFAGLADSLKKNEELVETYVTV